MKQRQGSRIFIPLLLHLQCLRSYLEDIADLCALFPNARIDAGKGTNMTLGQTSAMLRAVTVMLTSMKDFFVRVKVKEKDGDSVHVDVRAF